MTDKSAHWTYFIEFFVIPPIAFMLAGFSFMNLPVATALGLFVCGALTWTLAEYWIHRFLLHHMPYLSEQHDAHHREPKSYIGINSIGVFVVFVIIVLSLSQIFTLAISAAVTAGILTMYFVYIMVHHKLHHDERSEFGYVMNQLWKHHASHHRGGTYDFGVSTTLWDYVFFTKRLG